MLCMQGAEMLPLGIELTGSLQLRPQASSARPGLSHRTASCPSLLHHVSSQALKGSLTRRTIPVSSRPFRGGPPAFVCAAAATAEAPTASDSSSGTAAGTPAAASAKRSAAAAAAAAMAAIREYELKIPRGDAAGAALILEDVHIQAGERDLLQDVSWRLMPGQRVGLVGANGCGKSTLLRCLSGYQKVAC